MAAGGKYRRKARRHERGQHRETGARLTSPVTLPHASLSTQPVRELIGRTAYPYAQTSVYRNRVAPLTVDQTIPDYEFWDRLRRGKASGYTLGGLFCPRIEHIFATWVFGAGVEITIKEVDPLTGISIENEANQYTNTAINDFVLSLLDAGQDNQDEDSDNDVQSALMIGIYEDALGLGDQYVIVNVDGTLSIPSPDTVTCKRDPLDYRTVLSYMIETKLPDGYTITDEYRAFDRVVTIKKGNDIVSVQTYANLIGRIPVVHVANEMSGNETYGHPIHEDLLPLFNEYDDVIYKQLDGVKMMGNPTPVLKGLEDVEKTKRDNMPATNDMYADKDGNEVERSQFKLDRNAALLLGVGADFAYASPATGFTTDTQQALDTLFLLLQYRTGIPKFAWGDELASSRATAGVQADQFVKDIQGRRRDNGGWIVRLVKIWLQFKALLDPQIIVGNLALRWPELQQDDKTVQLAQITFARTNGLITDQTALTLLDLVDDPAEEVKAAATEFEARQTAMFPDGVGAGGAGGAGNKPPTKKVTQMLDDDDDALPASDEQAPYYIVVDAVRELRQSLLED